MDDALFGILKEAGPWVTFAGLIAFGLLIPRATHKERIKDYQDQLAYTKQALDHEREINKTQGEQVAKLLVLAEAGNKVLEALQQQTKESTS